MRSSTLTAQGPTRHHRRSSSASLGLISLCVVLLGSSVAGCGASSQVGSSATPTATPYPIATASSTAAFRASDGKQLWTGRTGGGCVTSALASDANYLYVNEYACYGVVALRLSDGTVAWQQPFGGGGAPTLVNGVLYVGPEALRASDGSILRTFQASGEFIGTDAVANGAVFISSNLSLSAWNATTGAQLWQIAHQGGGYIFGVANGALYASDGHNLNAYQTSNGTRLWSALVDPVVPQNDPLPASLGSTLYVGTLTGAVVALRASDGAMMWSTMLQ